MQQDAPSLTLGVEEEYLLVDAETLDLVEIPKALMTACIDALGDQVSPEFLRCQIEVGTGVCASVDEARADLTNLRRTIKALAAGHGIVPIAASTHPFSQWQDQSFTDRKRYRRLEAELEGVARRMLICGMHVHVGIEDEDLRIEMMNQFRYFLPHLLALSTSSPFWEGVETGLHSYRLTVFDNLPRTGLPPRFASFADYEQAVQTIIDTKAIEDSSKIWWDLRPSSRFPTLETRICDVMPKLDETLAIVALVQSLTRMLVVLHRDNKSWREYDNFLISENRWRAQRHGLTEGLIDFGTGEVLEGGAVVEELIALAAPHADDLGCRADLERVRDVLEHGTSAERQSRVFAEAVEGGADEADALRAVVASLVEEFDEGLDG